ncbi:tRNA (guanine(37)-N1)-methyltransferase [Pelobates cultripes]|uniref:tRNA (guanine(37)-N1)-methyltransferase n=2 Tax=Pelobates cultripes TaxID=61616 RepID=A0AAD1WZ95_PELCU|nr:tRNA (guanine(37)-N1)-methyltransferase [Pelobates cultripes]
MRFVKQVCYLVNLLHDCGTHKLNKLFKPCHQWSTDKITLRLFLQRGSLSTMAEMQDCQHDAGLYSPNPSVSGMTCLDRDAFNKTITVPVIRVKKEIINQVMKALKHRLVQRPHLKRVIEDPKDEINKLVLLDPFKVTSDESFEECDHLLFKKFGVSPQITKYELQLTYENFKGDEILRAVLPKGQDVTSGFSRVGHIAHMNLREHQLPYKNLIGQVILDKNPGITSVVNKINTIDSTYRNFQMEVLAGEENMITKVKENYITYEFDFSKVYWNPRLSTEHERIIHVLKPGDVLFDVFAGVGPFAIPTAKKNCIVYANDLNPESYKWLLHNCKLNKVDKKVFASNVDGRDFIKTIVKTELLKYIKLFSNEQKNKIHIVMNLPAMAIEFLDAFINLCEEEPCSDAVLPTVHCYSFSKDDNPKRDVKEKAESILGAQLDDCSVHLVRNVAPNKDMMCISFQVPAKVLYKTRADTADEPTAKRSRTEEESATEN